MAGGDAGVSFARDIRPLFRAIDVAHMKPSGHLLDDYAWMADAANEHGNARAVYESVRGESAEHASGGTVLERAAGGIVCALDAWGVFAVGGWALEGWPRGSARKADPSPAVAGSG